MRNCLFVCFFALSQAELSLKPWRIEDVTTDSIIEMLHHQSVRLHIVVKFLWIHKGGFFQKVWFVFQISKFQKERYSKFLSWASNSNFLPITVNNKFKFIWNIFLFEIGRFEKRITLSVKKASLLAYYSKWPAKIWKSKFKRKSM